jgi:two-component system, LytTR family, response regulator
MKSETAKLRAIIVDDESKVMEELIKALQESDNFNVLGSSTSVEEAFLLIKSTPCDVIFLDIQIIGGNAFDIINKLRKENIIIPPIVITTGNNEFAYAEKLINEYNEVVYWLKKPFWENWVQHREKIIDIVLLKLQNNRNDANENKPKNPFIRIESGRQIFSIKHSDIILVKVHEVKGKGTTVIVLEKSTIPCSLTLTQILQQMQKNIVQISRTHAINTDWVTSIEHAENEITLRNGDKFTLGPAYSDSFFESFKF